MAAWLALAGYRPGTASERALGGDKADADRVLSAADRLLDHVAEADRPAWGYWYGVPFLLTQRAIVHRALGRPEAAVRDLESGLAEMPPEHRDADWARDIRAALADLSR